jgi:hypothetical protein
MTRPELSATVRALLHSGLTVYDCAVLLGAHPRAIRALLD